jgi:hypothetical protein
MSKAIAGAVGFPEGRLTGRIAALLSLARTAVSGIRRTACALRGHVMVRHLERGRICLKCLACGTETHGWIIDVRQPASKPEAQPVVAGTAVRRGDRAPAIQDRSRKLAA